MTRGNAVVWIQRFFFAAGFVILGCCGAAWLDSRLRQAEGNRELDRILSRQAAIPAPKSSIPDGGLIGRVEIPKLHLSAVVFQGADSAVLDHGVGHVDSTALPGQPGNVVLAAHRDTFFRGLRNIRKGDMVTVTTESGVRNYQVGSTEIVQPTETSVLNPTAKPTLTLITCYPFYFVGHAPKRFIVRATEAPAQNEETVRSAPPVEETPPNRPPPDETSSLLTYIVKVLR
jgi:LPXTG-site transpeptidase (sortase) family protein